MGIYELPNVQALSFRYVNDNLPTLLITAEWTDFGTSMTFAGIDFSKLQWMSKYVEHWTSLDPDTINETFFMWAPVEVEDYVWFKTYKQEPSDQRKAAPAGSFDKYFDKYTNLHTTDK